MVQARVLTILAMSLERYYAICEPLTSCYESKAVPYVVTMVQARVLTIIAMSLERYYAICEPLTSCYESKAVPYVVTMVQARVLTILAMSLERNYAICKAVPFVELTVAHASVLTILAISFERYYAICEPLKAGYVCTKARAMVICLLAWALAALFTRLCRKFKDDRTDVHDEGGQGPKSVATDDLDEQIDEVLTGKPRTCTKRALSLKTCRIASALTFLELSLKSNIRPYLNLRRDSRTTPSLTRFSPALTALMVALSCIGVLLNYILYQEYVSPCEITTLAHQALSQP
ncbi:hypothetical protein J6590_004500 [Homalodisca vitripennis]|nr:hypothetical protein J6590_004500 [Homalodisca vitripennis]